MLETPPTILEYAPAPRVTSTPPATWSLLFGGALLFLAPFAVAFYSDALFVDPLPLVLAGLGLGVRRGRRAFAAWALALVTLFGLANVAAIGQFTPPLAFVVRPAKAPLLHIAPSLANVGWSVVTAYLLVRFLWPPADPGTSRRRRVLVLALLGLYALAGGSLALRRSMRYEAVDVTVEMATRLSPVDAETGQPLPVEVLGPRIEGADPWSVSYSVVAGNRIAVHWTFGKPLPIRVSSPGYIEQVVTLDRDAASDTVVRLRRAPSPATAP